MMKHSFLMLLLCLTGLSAKGAVNEGQPLAKGTGILVYDRYAPFADRPLEVHYHIPEGVDVAHCPAIMVFQGADRNYTYLLEAWRKEAENNGFIVFVPQFDLERFPLCDYQEVGIMDREHRQEREASQTTAALIDHLWQYICCRLGNRQRGFSLYGHSAGGQFVQRFMLFHPCPHVEKAIVGSPGWYTMADTAQVFPYGVKNISNMDREALRRYVETPVTLQLALGDTVRESYLRKTAEAEQQGRNRLERGRTFFAHLQQLAKENGWTFRWQKVEEAGLGHVSVEMGQRAVKHLISDEMGENGASFVTPFPCDTLGITPEGRPVVAYRVGEKGKEKVKIWMQGALHGNEPAGHEALHQLIKWLHETTEGARLLNKVTLLLVPAANPDGYARNQRKSGSGFDLNRDQTKLADPVTWMLKRAYAEFQPDVALDIHEYTPNKKEFSELCGREVNLMGDVLFLPSGHPNINPELIRLSQTLFRPQAERALAQHGYTTGFYFTLKKERDEWVAVKDAKSPQSSSSFQGLTGAVSLFIEIHGIGLDASTLERRKNSGFIVTRNILETAVSHADEIKQAVKDAEWRAIQGTDSINVSFRSARGEATIPFFDKENAETLQRTVPVLDAMSPIVQTKRPRPKAYLLTADCQQQVERLQAMGIRVERLERAERLRVEQYTVENCEQKPQEWERIHQTQVTTRLSTATRRFPAGTFRIPMNQRLGNLIAALLEPESTCGFTNFQVIKAEKGKQLPIYREPNP